MKQNFYLILFTLFTSHSFSQITPLPSYEIEKTFRSSGITAWVNFFIDKSSKVYTFGNGLRNGLGQGADSADRLFPVLIKELNGKKIIDLLIFRMDNFYKTSVFALDDSGQIHSWGQNDFGQLGLGDKTDRFSPTLITELKDIKITKIQSYGGGSVIATDVSGKSYVWGRNDFGQLGLGDTVNKETPTLLTLPDGKILKNIIPLTEEFQKDKEASFLYSVLAVTQDGKVYSWGDNSRAQLGLGDTVARLTPTAVTALDETEVIEINVVSSIDIMEYKSYTSYFVLEKSGKVYSWGKNDLGQLGVGDFTDRLSPTLISTLNEPILKIYSISYSSAMNGNFVSIFALAESGKVYSWGRSEYGILGIPDPDNVNAPKLISTLSNVKIKSLSSVGYTMFAIDDSSQVYSWGLDDKGQLGRTDSHSLLPAQITTFKNIGIKEIVDYPSSFNLNMKSVFAIATNGNLYAWGDNEYGQLGTGDKTNRLTPVLISSSNILKVITEEPPVSDSSPFFAISDSGEVYFWGNNKSFQLGLGKDTPQKVLSVTEISSLKGKNISQIFINGSNAFMTGGTGESILALDKDGKLYSWGFTNYNLDAIPFIYQYSPQLVEIFDLNKMVQNRDLSKISAGYSHSLAIHDGQVYSCGSNDKGQLGLGDAVERHSPSLVQALQGKNITQVVAGESFSLALDDNGEVYSFGDNSYGELGLGDNKVRYSPTFISSLQGTKIIQIAVRGSNNVGLALAQDGVLYAWGWIKDVTQNTPAPLDSNAGMSITEISSGGGDTLIFDNNKLYVWSFNGFVGVGISNQDFFVKGSSGSAHMHAMTEYGNLYSWGDNSYGQLGLNTTQSSSDHPIFMSFFEGVNIHLLEAGGSHSFAVSADDKKVYSWGLNQNGQLGIGNNLEKNSPEEVTAFKALNIVQVKAGKTFSLALDDKNNIYSFGNNDKGQLGLGHTENQNLPQLVKFTHSDNKNHSQSHMLEALYIGIPVACSAALITGVLILAKYKKIWCFSHKSPSEETLLAH